MDYSFGLDISFWQKEVDFVKMMTADPKPEFIAIRAGQGTYSIDPYFASNWEQAHERGLHRIAYHVMEFFGKGKLQAELLFDRARIYGFDPAKDKLCLDVELNRTYSRHTITEVTLEAIKRLKELTGVYPLMYSRASWMDAYLSIHLLPRLDWWLAGYRKRLPAPLFTPELDPKYLAYPKGVAIEQVKIHQTGERGNGHKYGVKSWYIDTNRFLGTRDEMKAWFGAAINEPEPIPEPPFPPVDQYPAGLLRVELWSQHDPRWGNDRMGESGVTLAQQGCLAVVTAIYLAYLGVDTDPKRYNALLGSRGGYQYNVKNGVKYAAMYWKYPGVLWPDKIAEDLSDYVWHSTGSGWEGRARRILESGRPVLAMVDMKPGGEINQHWVLIVGERSDGWWAIDPETGMLINLAQYGNAVYRIVAYDWKR